MENYKQGKKVIIISFIFSIIVGIGEQLADIFIPFINIVSPTWHIFLILVLSLFTYRLVKYYNLGIFDFGMNFLVSVTVLDVASWFVGNIKDGVWEPFLMWLYNVHPNFLTYAVSYQIFFLPLGYWFVIGLILIYFKFSGIELDRKIEKRFYHVKNFMGKSRLNRYLVETVLFGLPLVLFLEVPYALLTGIFIDMSHELIGKFFKFKS